VSLSRARRGRSPLLAHGANVRSRASGERGAAVVELALVLPVFLLLVFGVIEFGLTYNNDITLRQGAREAARQGAVGNFGVTFTTGSPCYLTGVSGASTDVENLMCLVKSQVGLNASKVRVKVLSGNSDFTAAGTFAKGDSLIVCAQYPLDPTTKIVSPVLGTTILRTKTSMRIETTYSNTETGGEETPPSGGDWSWCTVSGSAP
jgi:Flp pilus assembly protein TadG